MSDEPGVNRAGIWITQDTGRLCEECVARVEALMEEAQKLLTTGHFNTSVRAPVSPTIHILYKLEVGIH